MGIMEKKMETMVLVSTVAVYPRSPGTHIVGSWVIDSISSYRDPRTETQYIGNWASRVF